MILRLRKVGARLGQGPGKVLGKVRARLGQGPGKVWTKSKVQAIKIVRPLRVLTNRVLAVVITLDLVLIIVLIVLTRIHQVPIFTELLASCQRRTAIQSMDAVYLERIRIIVTSYMALPFFVILCCCVLCLFVLSKRNKAAMRTIRQRGLDSKKTQSIISILAFSMTGLVLNSISLGLVRTRHIFYKDIIKEFSGYEVWVLLYGNIVLKEITISCNSIINPIIFIWRMKDFRTHISSTVFDPASSNCAQYLVHILHCAQRIFRTSNSQQSEIELEEMRVRRTDNQKNIQNSRQINLQNSPRRNLQNSSDFIQVHPENEDPVQEIDDISSQTVNISGSVERNLETFHKLPSRDIGIVIVHRNAIKQDFQSEQNKIDQDSLSEQNKIDQDSASEQNIINQDSLSKLNKIDQDCLSEQNIIDQDSLSEQNIIDLDCLSEQNIIDQDSLSEQNKIDQDYLSEQNKMDQDSLSEQNKIDQDYLSEQNIIDQDCLSEQNIIDQDSLSEQNITDQDSLSEQIIIDQDSPSELNKIEEDSNSKHSKVD